MTVQSGGKSVGIALSVGLPDGMMLIVGLAVVGLEVGKYVGSDDGAKDSVGASVNGGSL